MFVSSRLRYVANPFAFAPPVFAGNPINVRESVTRLCEVAGSACAKKTSGPIPKFASIGCPFRCELRNLRPTSARNHRSMQQRLGQVTHPTPEFVASANQVSMKVGTSFGFGALAGNPF